MQKGILIRVFDIKWDTTEDDECVECPSLPNTVTMVTGTVDYRYPKRIVFGKIFIFCLGFF